MSGYMPVALADGGRADPEYAAQALLALREPAARRVRVLRGTAVPYWPTVHGGSWCCSNGILWDEPHKGG